MEQEGVIKFHCDWHQTTLPPLAAFAPLNSWRTIMVQLGLIGCDPQRYDGLGFGNISCQLDQPAVEGALITPFLISGTQTGHYRSLTEQQCCTVLNADWQQNRIEAEGPVMPSSEALTHAMIYAANPAIKSVIHVHSPILWQQAEQLAMPTTAADIAYGTVEMARAVTQMFATQQLSDCSMIAMMGHHDGLIAFGPTLDETGTRLVRYLAAALSTIENQPVKHHE